MKTKPMKTKPLLFAIGFFTLQSATATLSEAKPLKQVVIKWSRGVGNSLSQSPEFYGSAEAIRIAETDSGDRC